MRSWDRWGRNSTHAGGVEEGQSAARVQIMESSAGVSKWSGVEAGGCQLASAAGQHPMSTHSKLGLGQGDNQLLRWSDGLLCKRQAALRADPPQAWGPSLAFVSRARERYSGVLRHGAMRIVCCG